MNEKINISVVGAGGWGTSISYLLAHKDYNIKLWSFESEVVEDINNNRANSIYLKNAVLPENITATNNLSELNDSDLFVFAVPTQFIRSVLMKNELDLSNKPIVNLAKGIEIKSTLRVSELFASLTNLPPEKYSIISGPSHAEEVFKKVPTAVVTASEDPELAIMVQRIFSTEEFRVYTSNDVVGCEIGGSLKNVMAIAAGIIDGLQLGDNTKAALITRGLAEISRIGVALGANPHTFNGLSGLGDLIVTCNSRHSRNRYVGEQIGKGLQLDNIVHQLRMVAEGVGTTQSAYHLAKLHLVDTPIIDQVYHILFDNLPPSEAIKELMTRQSKKEWWW